MPTSTTALAAVTTFIPVRNASGAEPLSRPPTAAGSPSATADAAAKPSITVSAVPSGRPSGIASAIRAL